MSSKLELLKKTMYQMFKDGTLLDDLDMDDFEVMWLALMEKWYIKKPDNWEEFIDTINCISSNSYEFFSKKFNDFFYNLKQTV